LLLSKLNRWLVKHSLSNILITLQSSSLNFFRSSFVYFVWWTYTPSLLWLIWIPRKNFNSPIMLMSNSSCINFENSLQRDALVEPNIISTYICTTRMSFSRVLLKSVVSTWPLLKSFLIKKLLSLSYQALGACLRPYSDFLSL